MERINHFSLDVQQQLKNYVYALVDPRPDEQAQTTGNVFYIGRGVGDRVFSHEQEARHDHGGSDYAKLERIREIEQAGYQVKRWIICCGWVWPGCDCINSRPYWCRTASGRRSAAPREDC